MPGQEETEIAEIVEEEVQDMEQHGEKEEPESIHEPLQKRGAARPRKSGRLRKQISPQAGSKVVLGDHISSYRSDDPRFQHRKIEI